MSTAAMTAMSVSIGADFAIYFISRVREEWQVEPSFESAVRSSMRTSGKAIFYVSSAVVLGYMVLPISGFSLWERLGLLTAFGVGMSAMATLTLLPCLALLFRPQFLTVPLRGASLRTAPASPPITAECSRPISEARY
jgi:predicted RND superfamily exporter protein